MPYPRASLPLAATLVAMAATASVAAQDPQPRSLTIDDLFQLESVSSPVVSPDGSQVAYLVGTHDLEDIASADLSYRQH